MTYNLLRESGIGALACVSSDDDAYSLVQCTLQVKYKIGLHATFSLRNTTHIDGFTEAQPFNFIYNADNLVPATTTCMTVRRSLAVVELDHITRNQAPKLHALSLNLKKPCPILCPDMPGSISPKSSCEVYFGQLVALAKATEITILFDWNWLHRSQLGHFLTIVSQPETFTGFPIDRKNLRGRRLEDWSVFIPTERVLPSDPPSYADSNRKRNRQISGSPLPSPPLKRVLYTPECSPTEKATTISTPPRQPSSTVDGSPCSRHCPTIESPRSGSDRAPSAQLYLPNAQSPHIPQHLEDTMRKMMQQMLPEMLAQVVDTSKSISASPPPSDVQSITKPTSSPSLHLLRPLRAWLSARAAAHVERKITAICEDTVYDAHHLRNAADEEFIAAIEDQKLDMQHRNDDMLKDIQEDIEHMVDEKLRDLNATVAEYVEEAGEQIENTINEKVDKFLNRERTTEFVAPRAATVGNGRKTKRDGHTAGDRKRYRFCRRV